MLIEKVSENMIPDNLYDSVVRQDVQIKMLMSQLKHLNRRIEEEVNEKLMWRESAEFWEAQAEFFKERAEEIAV